MSGRLIMGFVVSALAIAQPEVRPTFEVASVKPSESGGPARLTSNPGMWSCVNCRLFDIFGYAYKVFEYQLDAPVWTKSTLFDVVAKLPPGFKPTPFSTRADADEFALMMQNLLKERFQIEVHREKREVPIYELQIAKDGLKLEEVSAPAPAPPPGPTVDRDGFPTVPGGDGMRLLADRGRIQFRAQSMANLAHFISTQVDRPVLDATGLNGRYALTLSWYRENLRPAPLPANAGGVPIASDPLAGPTIFEAIPGQLGLKLQPKNGVVEMVIIDRVARTPSAN